MKRKRTAQGNSFPTKKGKKTEIFQWDEFNRVSYSLSPDSFFEVDGSLIPALSAACKQGDLDVARHLVKKKGADVNIQDELGLAPLHHASESGHHKIIKFLLSVDANPNIQTEAGRTPLYVAAMIGFPKIITLLINSGADIHARCKETDSTALHTAVANRRVSIVKLLLSNNANVNLECGLSSGPKVKKITPLHLAGNCLEIMEMLLSKNPIITQDESGKTPLHLACIEKNAEVVELLLTNDDIKKSIDLQDKGGSTALFQACQDKASEIIQLLIAAKANPNIQNNDGRTPLHELSSRRMEVIQFGPFLLHSQGKCADIEIVRLLLEANADVNLQDDAGDTPLHEVADHGHLEIATALVAQKHALVDVENKEGDTPLCRACRKGHLPLVELLVSRSANINTIVKSPKQHWSPLLWACSEGHSADGMTALHLGAAQGSEKIVRLLLSKNADLNAPDTRLATPLHYACELGHQSVVEVLLERQDVEINAEDEGGITPLHYASFHDHAMIVRLLLAKNANVHLKDGRGSTALHLATRNGNVKIFKLLASKTLKENGGNSSPISQVEKEKMPCSAVIL